MNFRLILFALLLIACFAMLYMWYSANESYRQARISEDQLLYRIDALKAEGVADKRRLASLQKDEKMNREDVQKKQTVLNEIQSRADDQIKQKVQLQSKVKTLKDEYVKISKEYNDTISTLKSESESKLLQYKTQMKTIEKDLENLKEEFKKLSQKVEKEDLTEQKTHKDKVPTQNDVKERMQAKAPEMKKGSRVNSGEKVDDSQPSNENVDAKNPKKRDDTEVKSEIKPDAKKEGAQENVAKGTLDEPKKDKSPLANNSTKVTSSAIDKTFRIQILSTPSKKSRETDAEKVKSKEKIDKEEAPADGNESNQRPVKENVKQVPNIEQPPLPKERLDNGKSAGEERLPLQAKPPNAKLLQKQSNKQDFL